MFPIPDAWAAFYLTCFLVGLLFVFASFFLGLGHDALHISGFPHFGSDGHGAGGSHNGGASIDGAHHGSGSAGGQHANPFHSEGIEHSGMGANEEGQAAGHGVHGGGHQVSPISISTVMAFLTWFGGAGYILRVYLGFWGPLSVVASSLAGLAGGAIIFYFLVRVLLPGERVMDPADYRLEGTVAQVTVPITRERPGEILYTRAGTRRSEGARSMDGSAIEHGTEVVIVRYEHGIAYVEPWSSFLAKG